MSNFLKVAFHTLGCKLNFSETSAIAGQFEAAGYARVEPDDRPDVFVLNTCSVTESADRKCRDFVRRAIRNNPRGKVIVIGCYAQLKPEEIARIPGVSLVLGANEKFDILNFTKDLDSQVLVRVGEIKEVRTFIPAYSIGDRTRTFLKVQDGCNYFCSFCTIPLARGRSRSATVKATLDMAMRAVSAGARELVLTGVNIGDFGSGTSETLFDLLRELDGLEGAERIRISSIEPNLLTDEIIEFCAGSRLFMPHFHIPLQSGSDAILQLMRRRYLSGLYAERVRKILALMPDAAIGADVITGFPAESEADFKTTIEFLKDLPLAYLHVFSYSERSGTTAMRIGDPVAPEVRATRTRQLRILSEKMKRAFYARFVGQVRPVLFESGVPGEAVTGFTDNYMRVVAPPDHEGLNRTISVRLGGPNLDGVLVGTLSQEVF